MQPTTKWSLNWSLKFCSFFLLSDLLCNLVVLDAKFTNGLKKYKNRNGRKDYYYNVTGSRGPY